MMMVTMNIEEYDGIDEDEEVVADDDDEDQDL